MKPKIKLTSIPLLDELHKFIKTADIRGTHLCEAASDLFDGWLIRKELDDLIDNGVLVVIGYPEEEFDRGHHLCGSTWSVNITEQALLLFWPDRMKPRERPHYA